MHGLQVYNGGLEEFDFVGWVCGGAVGYGAGAVAGLEEEGLLLLLRVVGGEEGERGVLPYVAEVGLAHEAVVAGEFVDELDGGVVGGAYC